MKIAFVCAESSAELQAEQLARYFLQQDASVELVAMGGRRLERLGARLLEDTQNWAVMGLSQTLPRLWYFTKRYWRLRQLLLREKPDLTILIDAPAINMRLGAILKGEGLRTCYYFPPSAWSDNTKRMGDIASRCDLVVPTFAQNFEVYQKAGLEVLYLGHPMRDMFVPCEPVQAQRELGIPEGDYVCLMPGSRASEVKMLLDTTLGAARLILDKEPEVKFLLPIALESLRPLIEGPVRESGLPITLFEGRSKLCMQSSLSVLMASGSVSLEAALLGKPITLFYKIPQWEYRFIMWLLHRGWLEIDYIALPNLILREKIIEEWIQDEATPENLAQDLLSSLREGPERHRKIQDLSRLSQSLGQRGVLSKISAALWDFAQGMPRDLLLKNYGMVE